MKKHIFFPLAFLALEYSVKAQDQLFKKDNSKDLVKITEVGPDEIKYKLFSNPNGPVYVISKREVILIIYENGEHEVIKSSPEKPMVVYQTTNDPYQGRPKRGMSTDDSLQYFKNTENISINFLNFMNMELGFMYQKDFLKSHFNVVIPVAIGLDKPSITQSVYFGNTNYYAYYPGGQSSFEINKKLFEAGIGINYYPSLKYAVNYYIGPVFKYMQYSTQQHYSYYTSQSLTELTKNATLTRYTFSITNGILFRTRSRLTINLFASLGFKNDQLSDMIVEPSTNKKIDPIRDDLNVYFWSGFNVGFSF